MMKWYVKVRHSNCVAEVYFEHLVENYLPLQDDIIISTGSLVVLSMQRYFFNIEPVTQQYRWLITPTELTYGIYTIPKSRL
jgi:hypothetical protein